ncbi:MAG: hypothetical protein ACRDY7_05785, partial [Acidimicrobiia bacterium]
MITRRRDGRWPGATLRNRPADEIAAVAAVVVGGVLVVSEFIAAVPGELLGPAALAGAGVVLT